MKNLIRLLCALSLLSLGAVSAKKKAKRSETPGKFSECLKLKTEKEKADCILAEVKKDSGGWLVGEVSKSPINDAPSVQAILIADKGGGRMSIGCYEGQLYVNFDLNMYLSTLNQYFYPIIYRVDSEPAVDCTGEEYPQKCYGWALSSGSNAAGIWGNPDEFIQEIKDAKKLTVRLSNHSGDQKTAIFTLKEVLPTFEKIKGLCGVGGPEKTTEGETTP